MSYSVEDLVRGFSGLPNKAELLKAIKDKEDGARISEEYADRLGRGTVEERLAFVETALKGLIFGIAQNAKADAEKMRKAYAPLLDGEFD